jgi:hypothetical protein
MKKLILSLALVAAGLFSASAQGTVKFYNISSLYLVSTNGATTGKMATPTGGDGLYYFALLVDASTPTSSNPLTGGWALAEAAGIPLVGTNYSLVGTINGTGSASGVAVDNWAAGTSDYIELVGWSASLGTSYSTITGELATGWTSTGYYGVSSEGSIISGGSGSPAAPPTLLFGGTGIASGFTLTAVPEPTTMALAAMGGLSLLALRRKKA